MSGMDGANGVSNGSSVDNTGKTGDLGSTGTVPTNTGEPAAASPVPSATAGPTASGSGSSGTNTGAGTGTSTSSGVTTGTGTSTGIGTGSSDRLVWIDCEMTGLDLAGDALIEVAALVTDADLNILGSGVDVVIKPPARTVERMLPIVREMHTASGLLEELDAGVSLEEAQEMVLGYVREHVPEGRKAPLAGNTVGTDRGFLARDMPQLEGHLHYRVVDVSSIKELVRRWYPRVYFQSPAKTGNHRALGDIRDSIEELKYYRATVFVPMPGPDSETAKAAATLFGTGERP
jgi:oligoribonuclease